MSAHQPILPAKAIEIVEARSLDGAGTLLADFAAAGLVKTYALMREVRPAGGATEIIRDGQVPPEDWERIIVSGHIHIALNGGTVRLEGSPLQGGLPSVLITGISFSEAALVKILDRYCANSNVGASKSSSHCEAPAAMKCAPSTSETSEPQTQDVQPIKAGDLTASVAQTKQATGLSRTTINELMREGTLDRKKVGKRTLITVESIERLLGVKVAE